LGSAGWGLFPPFPRSRPLDPSAAANFPEAPQNRRASIKCGLKTWQTGNTSMPGTPPKLTKTTGITDSKIAASGTWKDEQTFQMTWRFVETPHYDTVTCHFDGDNLKIDFLNSVTQLSHHTKKPGRH
jgi:hypothetical protein